ncbi:hypothetical protein BC939DRAFT_404036 [Gamsiella multidivaricata]|uniref:uncharacterized protein n=1 Tax=Gamsiella multidivaricata TaxID=101098 RepID=UPI00221E8DDB|nr:uncharacterized protein BC939DRAFT_404036 [Gamsiella multidivaricata]KAI7816294.1 hypothetical protein BC939DRAFT_404036 [Gamsiella multidivaricata]
MGEKEVSRHRQSSSADSQTSRTRSPPSNQAQSRAKKAPHELLTDAEKKANHIASEQKRRQNIRIGFDSLVEIVPTLSECHRSEALILQKSVDYIHRLLSQKNELKTRVRDLQANLGEPNEDDDSVSYLFSCRSRTTTTTEFVLFFLRCISRSLVFPSLSHHAARSFTARLFSTFPVFCCLYSGMMDVCIRPIVLSQKSTMTV